MLRRYNLARSDNFPATGSAVILSNTIDLDVEDLKIRFYPEVPSLICRVNLNFSRGSWLTDASAIAHIENSPIDPISLYGDTDISDKTVWLLAPLSFIHMVPGDYVEISAGIASSTKSSSSLNTSSSSYSSSQSNSSISSASESISSFSSASSASASSASDSSASMSFSSISSISSQSTVRSSISSGSSVNSSQSSLSSLSSSTEEESSTSISSTGSRRVTYEIHYIPMYTLASNETAALGL